MAPAAAAEPDVRASPGPALDSPAEFYGFPQTANMGTPGGGAPRSASVDGVPRNADGIPTLTPATVTVRRGSFGAGLGVVLEDDDDDLAANLFESFSPLGDGVATAGRAFGSFSGGKAAALEAQEAAAAAAATPAAETAEFSFFPAAGQPSAAAGGPGSGTTPELPAAAQLPTISPEILGFYEQQEQAAQRHAGAGSSQAAGAYTPVLPK